MCRYQNVKFYNEIKKKKKSKVKIYQELYIKVKLSLILFELIEVRRAFIEASLKIIKKIMC